MFMCLHFCLYLYWCLYFTPHPPPTTHHLYGICADLNPCRTYAEPMLNLCRTLYGTDAEPIQNMYRTCIEPMQNLREQPIQNLYRN